MRIGKFLVTHAAKDVFWHDAVDALGLRIIRERYDLRCDWFEYVCTGELLDDIEHESTPLPSYTVLVADMDTGREYFCHRWVNGQIRRVA